MERFNKFREQLQARNVTSEFVLDKLLDIVSLLENPEKLKSYRANLSDVIKALELSGRYLKMFIDRKIAENSGGVEIVIVRADCEKCPYKPKGK